MAEQIEAPAQVSVAGQGRSGHRAKVYITLNKAHNGTKADLRTLLMSANGQARALDGNCGQERKFV